MAVLFNFPASAKTSSGGGTGGDGSLTSADFTYTGESSLSTDSGGWKIKFLSSGTFTPKKTLTIDAFIVGGGGAGGEGGPVGGYAHGEVRDQAGADITHTSATTSATKAEKSKQIRSKKLLVVTMVAR